MKTNVNIDIADQSILSPINVIIIGAGMYVCGINADDYGTVLPAVIEAKKKGLVDKISVVATDPENQSIVESKIIKLNKKMGTNIKAEYFPKGFEKNNESYKEVIQSSSCNTCAIVTIPDHLHFEVAKELITKGIHTLVVKPLSPKVDEVKELIKLQKQNDVYCAVEFHKRYDKSNLKLRELIKTNKIGRLSYFLIEHSVRKNIPTEFFKKWIEKTDIFQFLGPHYIDIIYFCTGFLPKRVMAIGQKNLLISNNIDNYDSIQTIVEWNDLELKKMFTSIILTNWIDPLTTSAMSDQKIKVIGTKGRIECEQKNRGLKVVSESEGITDINPYFSDFYYDIDDEFMNFRGYGFDSILQFINDSCMILNEQKSLADMKGLRATFNDALISTSVIEGVKESLNNKSAWVEIDINFT